MCNTMMAVDPETWEQLIHQDAAVGSAMAVPITVDDDVPAAQAEPKGNSPPRLRRSNAADPITPTESYSCESTAETPGTVTSGVSIGAETAVVDSVSLVVPPPAPPPPPPFCMRFNTAPEIEKRIFFCIPICSKRQLEVNPLAKGVRVVGKKQKSSYAPGATRNLH